MRVIIIGAGEVGYHLAQRLSRDSHDVVVVDNVSERCERISEHLDVLVVKGSGASAKTLVDAGIERADLLIAVSALDEVNIISCMMATHFGVKRKIARIRNPEYTVNDAVLKPHQLGIDLIINPEQTTAEEIVSLIEVATATDVVEFAEGRIQLLGIRLDPRAPILNRTLREVSSSAPELTFRTVAIFRNERTIIPSGNEYFRKGDQIFVTALEDSVPDVLRLCGKKEKPVHKVMILGASLVGRLVARMLEDEHDIDVILIDSNVETSSLAAEELKRTLVIRGEGSDVDLLAAEGIIDMDAFVAVTEDEENNIITCLLARHLGVERTIAMVSKADYVPLMPSLGLDAAVDKRLLTANAISRVIRRGKVVSVATLRGIDAEALEVIVQPEARIVHKELREVRFPADLILGAVIRDGEVFVPVGDTVLRPRDKVVIFGLPKALEDVSKLFG